MLAPLRLDDVGQLVADALHCEPERAQPLAQLVYEKTGGNPFFAIQFLTALAEEGLIAFDPVARAWQWDIGRIRAKNYTDNVVDLMAGKLKRLSTATQEALKQLACLGNVAEVATLADGSGQYPKTAHARGLWEAVHAGFVFRRSSTYTVPSRPHPGGGLFTNSARGTCRRPPPRSAVLARANPAPRTLSEHLFDVANQLNRAAERLIDAGRASAVAGLTCVPVERAKARRPIHQHCAYFASRENLLT